MRKCAFLLALLLFGGGCLPQGSGHRKVETDSTFLDRLTPAAFAKQTGTKFLSIEGQPGELVWLTGVQVHCLDENDEVFAPKHLAYSTLDIAHPEWHNKKLGTLQNFRLFGLGAGVTKFNLPPGYGIPVESNEPLWYTSRLANPDPYFPKQRLHQSITLDYTRQRGLNKPFVPVLVRGIQAAKNGESLFPLPPGETVVTTDVSAGLRLTGETKVVGVSAWMHRYAQYVILRDKTMGQEIWKFEADLENDGTVKQMGAYSSAEGIILQPGHSYELEASYLNEARDHRMGGAYLLVYLVDDTFEMPPR